MSGRAVRTVKAYWESPLCERSEGGGTRTHDQRIKSPLLYRLSYALGAAITAKKGRGQQMQHCSGSALAWVGTTEAHFCF